MVLVQAFLSFLGRSAGKVLNAIFGWAVIALFGRTSSRQETILSGVVAMAVLWPLLLVGIAAPKVATFLLAFIPLARSVPDSVVRIVWIALALLIPTIVGLVVAAKAPPGTEREPFVKRVLRGFPLTIGLAAAFAVMFLTVPALRIVSVLRGWSDEHVPLITEGDEYREAADQIDRLIEANDLDAARAEPPWWMKTPAGILRRMGGRALRGFIPRELAHWRGASLQIALYPSDALVRGDKKRASWTHGLIAETFARGPGLQTFDPDAQELERQVHRVWRVYENEPEAHQDSRVLLARVREAGRDLGTLDVPYEQWQVVYRKIVQLARAIEGEPQLLQAAASAEGGSMNSKRVEDAAPEPRPLESASTGELLGQFFRQTSELLRKELELAKAEVNASVKSGVTMIVGFAVAALFGLLGLGLLSAAAVLGLATSMAPWMAALIVGVAMLAIAGIAAAVARSKRVKNPLERTQKTLKEDVQWAKERMA
ncbi:MAG TPA: phage holin family protein [Candidatus Binatia bacterium]|nr:phage holin family protein [Candidatus Binatia bacterium]